MGSSGGGGGGGRGGYVPAGRAAAAVNDLVEAREGAARIRGFLQEQEQWSPWAEVVDAVLDKLSSALSALDVDDGTAADGVVGLRQTAESSAAGGTARKRRRSASGRSQRPSGRRVAAATLADGHVWRKYGQKEIQNSPNPRSYYRCTHKSTQGCSATRHVHVCETDPPKYAITYYGEHTCRDVPYTIPTVVIDAAGAGAGTMSDGRADNNNLISFAPGYAVAGGGGGGRGGAYSQLAVELGGATAQLCSSWTCATSEFSSSAEPFLQVDDELAAVVVGSAGMASPTVGSSLDYVGFGHTAAGGGDGGTGSFPTSPDSLGFVVGSLESIGDVFRLDP